MGARKHRSMTGGPEAGRGSLCMGQSVPCRTALLWLPLSQRQGQYLTVSTVEKDWLAGWLDPREGKDTATAWPTPIRDTIQPSTAVSTASVSTKIQNIEV